MLLINNYLYDWYWDYKTGQPKSLALCADCAERLPDVELKSSGSENQVCVLCGAKQERIND